MTEHFFLVFAPMVISNILHMVVVKKDLMSWLRIPISKTLFGPNKTWRGFIVLTLLNGCFYVMAESILAKGDQGGFILGALLGVAYMLFELPNSFIKRRMGISAGESSEQYRILLITMDKADSALGVSLAYIILRNLPLAIFWQLFLSAFCVHLCFSFMAYKIRLKEKL